MTHACLNTDPVGVILTRHGAPRVTRLLDDLTGTYLRLADLFGVNNLGTAIPPDRSAEAATDIHSDLAKLAATWADPIATREHLLTATRFAAGVDDLATMMEVDPTPTASPPADCVYAVYDLARGTMTFEFLHYLMLAEQFRARTGKAGLYVMFVQAPDDGPRMSSSPDHFLTRDRKRWRLANLLMSCAQLVPNCMGVHTLHNRQAAADVLRGLPQDSIFPANFNIAAPSCPYGMPEVRRNADGPRDIRALQAPALAATLVRRWFAEIAGTKPVVSITLRQSDYQPARNSNFAAWRKFAAWCAGQGFHPVLIPDTEALLSGNAQAFDGFSVLNLPALSIGYRMAVYQESFVNMMVNNGPYGMCVYHPTARYLTFKMLNPGVPVCTANFLTAQGITPDCQLPFAGAHQRLVWEMDEEEPLRRAFTALVEDVLAEPFPSREAAIG